METQKGKDEVPALITLISLNVWAAKSFFYSWNARAGERIAFCDEMMVHTCDRQVRHVSHRGSKQQQSSRSAITLLLLVRATYIWCCSLSLCRDS